MREARTHWAVENNPYQLWHRGYVAVKGGAMDCPYTFMHDMVNGRFRLPWEADVVHTDGSSCGFAVPTRTHDAGNRLAEAAAAVDVPVPRGAPVDDARTALTIDAARKAA